VDDTDAVSAFYRAAYDSAVGVIERRYGIWPPDGLADQTAVRGEVVDVLGQAA
jgi:hypothetical protein